LQTYLEIASSSKSFLPVNRNGWWIKFSTYNSHNVLLVITSMFTGQTLVRYYDDEEKAVNFINYIIECDPELEIPQ
jgi:hypothetical protein